MFQVHPFAILTVIAVTMCWALAVVLFRVGMPGGVARKLAVLLVLEGLTLGSSDAGVLFWLVSPEAFYEQNPVFAAVQGIVHTLGDVSMLALYPPFLAAALQTRLTRPFSNKRVRAGLIIAAVLLFGNMVLNQGSTVTTAGKVSISLLYLSMAGTFLYALAASINAWLIATGTERPKALIVVLAFGFRDICWTFVYSVALWEVWYGPLQVATDAPIVYFRITSYVLGTMVAVPLIAYGILRTRLFDIDLRIRWTIKQSTVAAAILAIVFLVSEGASTFLSAELGNVFGLLAAAVVMFFLAPLQRFAERVASAAMPNTENTQEYKAFRKMQAYESAVAEARQSGGISTKERALLIRLRDSLGISESDAEAIERGLDEQVPDAAQVQPA
jgi:hypothetical protein